MRSCARRQRRSTPESRRASTCGGDERTSPTGRSARNRKEKEEIPPEKKKPTGNNVKKRVSLILILSRLGFDLRMRFGFGDLGFEFGGRMGIGIFIRICLRVSLTPLLLNATRTQFGMKVMDLPQKHTRTYIYA